MCKEYNIRMLDKIQSTKYQGDLDKLLNDPMLHFNSKGKLVRV